MESATLVQILDEAVCISFCADAVTKGMNLFVLTPTQLSMNSGKATSLGEGKP